tara:strand:+ start:35 stop:583 length:549 start_codon:yes stop_codon:yes gene_type:complete
MKVNYTDKKELEDLLNMATQVCGLRKGSLSTNNRRSETVLPRAVVSVIALKELGIHYNLISNAINRDRTTVYAYERNHESNLIGWKNYRQTFEKIYNVFQDLKSIKKSFSSATEMINHLHDMGITICKEDPDMFIQIYDVDNDFYLDIDTDTKEFSKNMEICKIALKNYNCKIKIKNEKSIK